MNATITIEDHSRIVRVKTTVVDAELEDLVDALRDAVTNFRRMSKEPSWTALVEVVDA